MYDTQLETHSCVRGGRGLLQNSTAQWEGAPHVQKVIACHTYPPVHTMLCLLMDDYYGRTMMFGFSLRSHTDPKMRKGTHIGISTRPYGHARTPWLTKLLERFAV